MNAELRNPGVRFPPPLIFAGGLLLGWVLHRQWPLPRTPDTPPALLGMVAGALLLLGVLWIGWGLVTFRAARTGILPHHPASRLVDEGPYRFGRNPMYLGMSLAYLGITLWIRSFWPAILFPVVFLLLVRLVIGREERYLWHAFGREYDRYCERVPRWFSFPRR